jgi:hypothetical protein
MKFSPRRLIIELQLFERDFNGAVATSHDLTILRKYIGV